jgi:hypothetical protein
MSVINFGQSVTLQEFAHGIGTVGKALLSLGKASLGLVRVQC